MTTPEYKFGEWYPIESAPKASDRIDLWVVERVARTFSQSAGERVPNAMWGSPRSDQADGWLIYEPGYGHRFVEEEDGGKATVATHWMPLPPPPVSDSTTDTLKRE